jgi:hypothetical protein
MKGTGWLRDEYDDISKDDDDDGATSVDLYITWHILVSGFFLQPASCEPDCIDLKIETI